MHKLYSQIKQVSNLSKQISNIKIHLSFHNIIVEILECHITDMSLKELGKEELRFTMELIGGQFVMILISTWLQLMFSADLSIPDSELSTGQMLTACHTPDTMSFLMDTKNQFWWTMFHALETKITLANAHIDLSVIAITQKTS